MYAPLTISKTIQVLVASILVACIFVFCPLSANAASKTGGGTKNVQSKPANGGTANSPLTNASKSGNARKKFNDTSQQIIGNVK